MIKPSFYKALNEEDMTLKDNIVEFLFFNPVVTFFRRSAKSVCRLIRWAPIIWKQHDWDYGGIHDLLEQKMKDLRKELEEDVWHDGKEVQTCIRQIDLCLKRLAIIKNWTDFYDYPTDDISWESTEDGYSRMVHNSEENEKKRQEISRRIDLNEEKFWKNFVKWHRNWWT